MNIDTIMEFISTRGVDIGINLAAAILIWIVGRWIIKKVTGFVGIGMTRGGKIDKTLAGYIVSILGGLLTVLLVMFILSRFGIETTSFAALLAGAGLAIGTAWGGLLAHFAAGVFMQVLRPFKIGDYVFAGDVEGTVTEIGLFTSTILTIDNVTTIVGNNKIFSDNIKNFSAEDYRRVDCEFKTHHSVNVADVLAKLKASVSTIPNIKKTVDAEIEVLEFTDEGPTFCVRPFCHNDHYWQVLFDTNKMIAQCIAENNWPAPAAHEVEFEVAGHPGA